MEAIAERAAAADHPAIHEYETIVVYSGLFNHGQGVLADAAASTVAQAYAVDVDVDGDRHERTSICTGRLNGHDAYAYMKDILERLPSQPASRIGELLPRRWAPAK